MDFDGFDAPLTEEDVAVLTAYTIAEENERQSRGNSTNTAGTKSKGSGCCCNVLMVFLIILIVFSVIII